MLKVKIISYPRLRIVEEEVNKWLFNNKVEVVSLQYSTAYNADSEDRQHSVLISYKEKGDEKDV